MNEFHPGKLDDHLPRSSSLGTVCIHITTLRTLLANNRRWIQCTTEMLTLLRRLPSMPFKALQRLIHQLLVFKQPSKKQSLRIESNLPGDPLTCTHLFQVRRIPFRRCHFRRLAILKFCSPTSTVSWSDGFAGYLVFLYFLWKERRAWKRPYEEGIYWVVCPFLFLSWQGSHFSSFHSENGLHSGINYRWTPLPNLARLHSYIRKL